MGRSEFQDPEEMNDEESIRVIHRLRLAQREALGQLPTVTVPDKATREWRGLIAGRQDLIGRRVALQNASAPCWSARGCPRRVATAPGLRRGCKRSRSTPGPWPSVVPTNWGACWSCR